MNERLEKIVEGAYGLIPPIASIAVAANYPKGNFTGKYLIEIAFPFGAYFLTKLISPYYGASFENRGRFVAGSLLFLFYGLEFTQKFTGFFGRKFDPGDFIAYTIGIGLALAADKLTFR